MSYSSKIHEVRLKIKLFRISSMLNENGFKFMLKKNLSLRDVSLIKDLLVERKNKK